MIECQAIQVNCFGALANMRIHQYKVIGWMMIALAKFDSIVSSCHFLSWKNVNLYNFCILRADSCKTQGRVKAENIFEINKQYGGAIDTSKILDYQSYSPMKITLPIEVFMLKMFLKIVFEKILRIKHLKRKKKNKYSMHSLDFHCIHVRSGVLWFS